MGLAVVSTPLRAHPSCVQASTRTSLAQAGQDADEAARVQSVSTSCKKLRKTKTRQLSWAKQCVGFVFNRNLTQRDFEGLINFDDKERTMEPVVYTQRSKDGAEETKPVPVKQLSGGERSYSSVCLVLALKEATMTPLLALDEIGKSRNPKHQTQNTKPLLAMVEPLRPTPFALHPTRYQLSLRTIGAQCGWGIAPGR
jgi:hypothetical protein